MATPKPEEYTMGWNAAFDAIAKYVEEEVCIVTGLMIRRMKDETWRFEQAVEEKQSEEGQSDDKVDG